jgi:hypothetical protein
MEDYKIVENITEDAGTVQLKVIPLVILLLALAIMPIIIIYDINRVKYEFLNLLEWQILMPLIIIGTVIHELLHGIGWMIAGKVGWQKMKFGINWKGLVPYAHCSQAMPLNKYLVGVLLPYLLLGLLPLIIGLLMGDFFLLLSGIIFSIAATGDIYMAWLLRKRNATDLILDHPNLIGCQIVEKIKKPSE